MGFNPKTMKIVMHDGTPPGLSPGHGGQGFLNCLLLLPPHAASPSGGEGGSPSRFPRQLIKPEGISPRIRFFYQRDIFPSQIRRGGRLHVIIPGKKRAKKRATIPLSYCPDERSVRVPVFCSHGVSDTMNFNIATPILLNQLCFGMQRCGMTKSNNADNRYASLCGEKQWKIMT